MLDSLKNFLYGLPVGLAFIALILFIVWAPAKLLFTGFLVALVGTITYLSGAQIRDLIKLRELERGRRE